LKTVMTGTHLAHSTTTHKAQFDSSGFLGRSTLLSAESWHPLVAGKTILITGAAGSIGSSLTRLLVESGLPHCLVLFDRSRSGLRILLQACQQTGFAHAIRFIEGNILDTNLLHQVFLQYEPEIVFHAAALKHLVPLETDPYAALLTNVLGTQNVMEVASRYPVRHFINVSTDKAVVPTSILGASKRIAELLLLAQTHPFCAHSVRMGNVLGSSGSIVPIFIRALETGSQLELTEPGASRYFMTVEESANFLLQSLAIDGPSLLLPEMGSPRRVCELADFIVQQWQPGPASRPMVHIGLRDGEKYSEQLTCAFEYLQKTSIPHMYRVLGNTLNAEDIAENFLRLRTIIEERRTRELLDALINIVPNFQPSPTLLRTCAEGL
jgi:FlaA1/EpsC-like NDP-sugar epimerase